MSEQEKVCTSCKKLLPLNAFGKDKQKGDGLASRCRKCRKVDAHKSYRRNIDYFIRRNRKNYEDNAEMVKESSKRYYNENREACIKRVRNNKNRKVRQKVAYAVSVGKIQRPNNCEKCKVECKPDGHHHDYNKPLDVVWLCTTCHGKEHRIYA